MTFAIPPPNPNEPTAGEPPAVLPEGSSTPEEEAEANSDIFLTTPVPLGNWVECILRPGKGTRLFRFVLFYAGVLVPLGCSLAAAFADGIFVNIDPWQSGELHIYASYLLSGQAGFPFYPFLVYAMIGCTLVLWDMDRFGARAWVRWGLCTGVVLAVHYLFVHGFVLTSAEHLLGWQTLVVIPIYTTMAVVIPAVACLIIWSLWHATRRWLDSLSSRQQTTILVIMVVSLLLVGIVSSLGTIVSSPGFIVSSLGKLVFPIAECVVISLLWRHSLSSRREYVVKAIVIVVVILFEVTGHGVLGFLVFAPLIVGPAWCLAVYATLAIYTARRFGSWQFRLSHLFLLITWLGAYFAAWRVAMNRTLVLYAQLPTEQPQGCYIATAAASGHRRLVGWRSLRTASGGRMRVNDQLVWLKCGELALKATAPRLHRQMRRVYDRLGPPLARRLRHNRWLADAAYLALKPPEWATRLALRLLVGDIRLIAARLYGSEAEYSADDSTCQEGRSTRAIGGRAG